MTTHTISGPLMIDVAGQTLSASDRELIAHPSVGGIILFTRNYANPTQLRELVKELRAVKSNLLIAVDHEGGRIQRFRDGFTTIPAAATYGIFYDRHETAGLLYAQECAWLLATELLAFDIDFSFAPVVDLDRKISEVIGNRSFHRDPDVVAHLAISFMDGMHKAGMAAVAKHFPGHGSVQADSHHAIPVDDRDLDDIMMSDVIPFAHIIEAGVEAVMPAHIIYSQVDSVPAGFSSIWLQEILREQLGFNGVIISDDLSMAGAAHFSDVNERVRVAQNAGCDLLLICNDRAAAEKVIHEVAPTLSAQSAERLQTLIAKKAAQTTTHDDKRRQRAVELITTLKHPA